MSPVELSTPRLLLRRWRPEDLHGFAELNADPRVMEYFPAVLSREQSDELAQTIIAQMDEQGWGLWAVELRSAGEFIGFVGLCRPRPDLPPSPCVEVGWRLAHRHWGFGYAPEAARASLHCGFEVLGLDEIVSMTSVINRRSQKVMHKIGMTHASARDFEHPRLAEGDRLRPHVLYTMSREQWSQAEMQRPPHTCVLEHIS